MVFRRGKIAAVLLLVIALPIALQFIHVLYHHVDFHDITHFLDVKHHHHNQGSNDNSEHCNICEYDFASFDFVETFDLNSYILIKFDFIKNYYQSSYQLINISSNLLRGPPQLLA